MSVETANGTAKPEIRSQRAAEASGTLNSAHVRNMQPAEAFAGYATSHDTSSISSCTGQNQQLRWKNTAGLELHSEACSPNS